MPDRKGLARTAGNAGIKPGPNSEVIGDCLRAASFINPRHRKGAHDANRIGKSSDADSGPIATETTNR
jgi:hypothetical protein